MLTPFEPIEDVNIPRGRKGGFVPKVIDRLKAFKKKIAKILVEMSNLRAKCPRSEWPLIKAKIHKIYFALNERDARENGRAFIKKYKNIFPRLVDCIKKDLDNCIAYMKHPFRRWRHIR